MEVRGGGATTDVPGSTPSSDERVLVGRARFDPDAFAELYRRYLDRVHTYAFRRTGSREAAEDVTAATFERAYRYLDRFEWRPGGFAPWLFRIASNELANHYRDRYRDRTPRAQAAMQVLQPAGQGDEAALEEIEERVDGPVDEVLEAMHRLNPRYQQALSLRFLAGLSVEDCAAAMECSKPVLSVTVHRALGALRRAMKEQT